MWSVNIVIVSDHGMVTTAPGTVTRVEIDDYLPKGDLVENIADMGAYINIKVKPGNLDEVRGKHYHNPVIMFIERLKKLIVV